MVHELGKGPAQLLFHKETRPKEWFRKWVRVLPIFVSQYNQTRGMVVIRLAGLPAGQL